jgi:hypothetical protein
MNDADPRNNEKKPFFKKWWFWVIALMIIGFASSAENGVTIVKDGVESLNPNRFGRYSRTINNYESSFRVLDAQNIEAEIRSGFGWADKKGRYSVKKNEMTVTWDLENTNIPGVSSAKTQTFKLGSGSSSSGNISWYEIQVGETSYLKKR